MRDGLLFKGHCWESDCRARAFGVLACFRDWRHQDLCCRVSIKPGKKKFQLYIQIVPRDE